MLHEAEKLMKEANELKELCVKQVVDTGVFEYLDGEAFDLYKKTFSLMDHSMNLVMEQCKLFDEMDKKLDEILKKLESKED